MKKSSRMHLLDSVRNNNFISMNWSTLHSWLIRLISFFTWLLTSFVLITGVYGVVFYPESPAEEYDWGLFSTFTEEILDTSDISTYLWSGRVTNADTLEGIDSTGLQVKIFEECTTGTFLTSVTADGRIGCDGATPPEWSCGTASGSALGAAPSGWVLCWAWNTASLVTGAGPWDWTCTNGTTVNCSATIATGQCWTAHNTSVTKKPTKNLCVAGNTASRVSTVWNEYRWTCTNGATVNCMARKCSCDYNGTPVLIRWITPLIYEYDITFNTSQTCDNGIVNKTSSCVGDFYHLKSSVKDLWWDPKTLTCEYYWIKKFQYPKVCN